MHRLWAGTKLVVAAEVALDGLDLADVGDARGRHDALSRSSSRRPDPPRCVPSPAQLVLRRLRRQRTAEPLVLGEASRRRRPRDPEHGRARRMGAFHRAGGHARDIGRDHRLDDTARRGRARALASRSARCAGCGCPSTSGSSRSRWRSGACRCSSTRSGSSARRGGCGRSARRSPRACAPRSAARSSRRTTCCRPRSSRRSAGRATSPTRSSPAGGSATGGNLPGARFRVVDGFVLAAGTALCVVSLAVLHL